METTSNWHKLLNEKQGLSFITLCCGMLLYAVTTPISYTVLPAIINELNADSYYAWVAGIFALGSFIGASLLNLALNFLKTHLAYTLSLLIFAFSTFVCAYAPTLVFLIISRFIMGLTGGLIVALTYDIISKTLPNELLPQGIGFISGMWGIATLLGPLIGGSFENWRIPFLILSFITFIFSIFVFLIFRGSFAYQHLRQNNSQQKTSWIAITLLSLVIFVLSIGSVPDITANLFSFILPTLNLKITALTSNILALSIAFTIIFLLYFVECRTNVTFLPRDSFSRHTVLMPIYLMIIFNMVALGAIRLYLPVFLQNLHHTGQTFSGYITFLDSIGWSLGAIIGACLNINNYNIYKKKKAENIVFVIAPLICVLSMGSLLLLLPTPSQVYGLSFIIGIAFLITGFFTGIFWPHILALLLLNTKKEEREITSSSIVTIQLFAPALADCFGGVIVNASGFDIHSNTALSNSATILLIFGTILLFLVLLLSLKIKNIKKGNES